MEAYNKTEESGKHNRNEIYSSAIRAGKRTYFFDVKATRKDEYYLTITESKKRFDKEGNFSFEKHKIFLYKEDFDKFSDGLTEVLDFINSSSNETFENSSGTEHRELERIEAGGFTNIEFDDLSE